MSLISLIMETNGEKKKYFFNIISSHGTTLRARSVPLDNPTRETTYLAYFSDVFWFAIGQKTRYPDCLISEIRNQELIAIDSLFSDSWESENKLAAKLASQGIVLIEIILYILYY